MGKLEHAPNQNAFEIIDAKLQALQGSLHELVQQAGVVFEEVFPRAPHPLEVAQDFPVFATQYEHLNPEGIPKVRELTFKLGSRDWLRIFKDAGTGYRDMMIWSNRPHGFHMRRTVVQKFPEDVDHPLPYGIDVEAWNPSMNKHLRRVGDVLVHPNTYIDKTQEHLQQALQVAERHL